MPNIKSAKKRVRVTKTKTLRNKKIKNNLKTVLKSTNLAISEKKEDAVNLVIFAMKKIDQAGAKGIFHKNKVARLKSSLQRSFNSAN